MKKIKYIIFALFLSIILIPNVSAKGVEIKSITLDTKSDNTIIKTEPTFNGLVMNFDLSFKQKDDFAKFKVTIKNDTNTDYKISNDTSFNESEHITYSYDVEDILKPKGEAVVYVTITYSNEVDPSELVNGMYKEENKAILKLLDKNGTPTNPNTGVNTYLMIFFLILLALIITLLIATKHNKIKGLTILLIGLFLIPSLVYAAETLRLTINTKVEIESTFKVKYIIDHEGFFKDEELQNFDMSNATCDEIYYIGNVSENNKYTKCSGRMIFKDNNSYNPGTSVNLKTINIKGFVLGIIRNGQIIDYCEEQSDGVFVCPENLEYSDDTIDYWEYTTFENPKWNANDKEIMNFGRIASDYWDTRQCFMVFAPQTFTMPSHDVTFYINKWGEE